MTLNAGAMQHFGAELSSAAHYADKCLLMNFSVEVDVFVHPSVPTLQVTCNCAGVQSHAGLKFHLCEMEIVFSDCPLVVMCHTLYVWC